MTQKNKVLAGFIPYGGLGNQLFQFATALSLKTKESADLAMDILGVAKNNVDGNPEILDFDIQQIVNLIIRKRNRSRLNSIFISTQLRLSNKVFQTQLLNNILTKCLRLYSVATSIIVGIRVLSPNGLGWDSKLKPSNESFTLLGNFHSYLFIDDQVRSELRNSLKSRKKSTQVLDFEALAALDKPTAIHVRLGDYLSIDELNVVNKEYFASAIEMVELAKPNSNYWIFTNDESLARDFVPNAIVPRSRFIPQSLNAAQTMEVMWLCDTYIISNSTFSWWGAFLSVCNEPLVVAPKKWFKNLNDPLNICPPDWVRL